MHRDKWYSIVVIESASLTNLQDINWEAKLQQK